MSDSRLFRLSPSPSRAGYNLFNGAPSFGSDVSRRDFLKIAGVLGGAGLLAACGGGGASGTGAVKLQSNLSDAVPKKALADLVSKYQTATGKSINISTIDHNTFQINLANYLNANNPPDMLTWFAGNRVRFFANKGLLADVSDAFSNVAGYTPVLKNLASLNGKQYIMPITYYWWAVFYVKSTWQKFGYQAPTDWQGFINLAKQMKSDGLTPIAFADADGWPAGGWFDFINMRLNGYDFHIRLMAGQESFQDPKVKQVFDTWREILPYTSPNAVALKWQDAVTPLVQGKAGMYMLGAFLVQATPDLKQDDFDFFPFPTIDPTVPMATEAPTDGWIISSRAANPSGAKDFAKWSVLPDNAGPYATEQGGVIPVNAQSPTPSDIFVAKGAKLLHDSAALSQFFDRDSSPAFSQNALGTIQGFLSNPSDIDGVTKQLDSFMQQAANA
ncbi:MAG TPA: extracellular solute-binding protein [Ktedonobacterales bacterium]|nr:extracellular solute-binding protein [Ktedonobacterales bacterium]